MTTNPERLWVICEERWGSVLVRKSETSEAEIRLYREHLAREVYSYEDSFTEPAEYVLASTAAAEREAAAEAAVTDTVAGVLHPDPEIDAEVKRERDEARAFDRSVGLVDGWHKDSDGYRLHVAQQEAEALRRERDALAAHLGRVLRMFKDETSQGDGMHEDHVLDYEAAKAALATAKGADHG